MAIKHVIHYTFDGSDESVRKVVRQFTTSFALEKINTVSAKLLLNQSDSRISKGAELSYFIGAEHKLTKKQRIIITGWYLQLLAYFLIYYSNDNIGKKTVTDNELAGLIGIITSWHQEWERSFLLVEKPNIYLYLYGFAGQQFKYQNVLDCFYNAGRELYIIFECPSNCEESIDIPQIVNEQTSMTWESVITYLLLACCISIKNAHILNIKDCVNWNNEFTYSQYKCLIEQYSLSYKDVRNSDKDLKSQVFYTKPFVKTQIGDIISINTYLNIFAYEHSIFWIIRNYYYIRNNRKFTADFGSKFEYYFENLLKKYLAINDYERIKEGSKPRADWKLCIIGYDFLVEQKSSILSVLAKQQQSNINALTEFCKNNIIKAITQLQASEDENKPKKFFKVVLMYEDYIDSEILDEIFELDDCEIKNDGNFWMMTISEFEAILCLYSEDKAKFCDVINEKIKRNSTNCTSGKSLSKILFAKKVVNNHILKDNDIKYYTDLAVNNVNRILHK